MVVWTAKSTRNVTVLTAVTPVTGIGPFGPVKATSAAVNVVGSTGSLNVRVTDPTGFSVAPTGVTDWTRNPTGGRPDRVIGMRVTLLVSLASRMWSAGSATTSSQYSPLGMPVTSMDWPSREEP